MASRRGMRGYSKLIQEAVDRYLESDVRDFNAGLLALQGSLTADEAEKLRANIKEMWSMPWRTTS